MNSQASMLASSMLKAENIKILKRRSIKHREEVLFIFFL